jgi:hypothetical protein
MNNTQLYLSIGLPLFTLLLVFIANNRAIDALSSEMKTSTDALRTEIKMSTDALRTEMHAGFQMLNQRIDDTNDRISRMERRLDVIDTEIRINHDSRLAVLEARILERAS